MSWPRAGRGVGGIHHSAPLPLLEETATCPVPLAPSDSGPAGMLLLAQAVPAKGLAPGLMEAAWIWPMVALGRSALACPGCAGWRGGVPGPAWEHSPRRKDLGLGWHFSTEALSPQRSLAR